MNNSRKQNNTRIAMLDRWRQSNKSKMEFCKEEKITYGTLYYWQRKLPKKNVLPLAKGFIKLNTLSPTTSSPTHFCELITINGSRLVFHQQPKVSFLKQLL